MSLTSPKRTILQLRNVQTNKISTGNKIPPISKTVIVQRSKRRKERIVALVAVTAILGHLMDSVLGNRALRKVRIWEADKE